MDGPEVERLFAQDPTAGSFILDPDCPGCGVLREPLLAVMAAIYVHILDHPSGLRNAVEGETPPPT